MSEPNDPVRWADPASDCDPLLRRLIGSARDGLGDAADATLAARVERAVRTAAAADSDMAATTSRSLWPWVGVAALCLGLSGAMIVAGTSSRALPAADSGRSSTVTDHKADGSAAGPARASIDDVAAPAAQVGTGARAGQRQSSSTEREVGTREHEAAEASLSAVGSPQRIRQSAKPEKKKETSSVRKAPRAGYSDRTNAQTAVRTEATPAPVADAHRDVVPDQQAVPPELSLISAAQRTLRRAPEEALALTAQHARAYPNGRFSEEREEIAISALFAIGERSAAHARARAFLSQRPNALSAPRIQRLLDTHR